MFKEPGNLLYAQAGGMTCVINASACGVIETAFKHKPKINKLFAARHGIQGVLQEELYDLSKETAKTISSLRNRPGGAFGSCRYKLAIYEADPTDYQRLIAVFKAHNIRYFLYNGGNDSADTAKKIALISKELGYEVNCIGIPKTVDNDLAVMDSSPGYGSAAKFIATATKETGFDIASMSPATQIYILEVPGRHAGWLAAAAGLAKEKPGDAPHIILCPEVLFNAKKFLAKVDKSVKQYGYCSIVSSESLRDLKSKYIAMTEQVDQFGHVQLGGIAPILARLIFKRLGYKYHYTTIDYVARTASHLGCTTDIEQAYALGKAAVEYAIAGKTNICPIVVRKPGKKYRWKIVPSPLEPIANTEHNMPRRFISKDEMYVTPSCLDYIRPLIQGEHFPPFKNGLPHYPRLKKILVKKRLAKFKLR